MSTELVRVVGSPDVEVRADGLTVVVVVDPEETYGEAVDTALFPEEAKRLCKALKRAIRAAKNPD